MSDQYDGQLPDGETSPELAETARRLATDAVLWSAGLPSAEHVAQNARQAPYTVPREATTDTAIAPISAPYEPHDARPLGGHESMPASRVRAFLAVATAVVVVALLAILFSTFGRGRAPSSTVVGSGGPTGTPGSEIATAIPTPASPYAQYVTNIVLANNVDSHGNAVGPSTQFFPHQGIFLVMRVDNPPPGTHVIEAVWFFNGSPVAQVGTDTTNTTVSGSANVFLMEAFPMAGQGTVRVLWDPPAGDDGSASGDPHLFATLNFTVADGAQTPTPGPATTSGPTPAPGPTPTPGPTATPGPIPTLGPTPTPSPAG